MCRGSGNKTTGRVEVAAVVVQEEENYPLSTNGAKIPMLKRRRAGKKNKKK